MRASAHWARVQAGCEHSGGGVGHMHARITGSTRRKLSCPARRPTSPHARYLGGLSRASWGTRGGPCGWTWAAASSAGPPEAGA